LLTCLTRFEAMCGHQEQIREGSKAQSGQYLAGWVGLLHLVSEPTSLVVQLCRWGRRAP
jgi:hypothetical protein